ncbi:MAG: hypothetical protein AB8B85_01910 [Paracoccaceae bacterium]
MNSHDGKLPQIVAIFILSVLASFVVLNRWVFTDIGLLSFGRVWQFYISYEDFGFVRRALVGTVFSVTRLNSILQNEYHFALLAQHVAIFSLAMIIFSYVVKIRVNDLPFIATLALSPALLMQSGYTTGSLDAFILILVSINILYCSNLAIFCIILAAGILIHELFVFTIPAQLVAYYFHLRQQEDARLFVPAISTMASTLIPTILIILFGSSDLSRDTFDSVMEGRIPFAAGQHGLWSGYYEISSTASKYMIESKTKLAVDITLGAAFLIVPLIYAILVWLRLLSVTMLTSDKVLLSIATVFPLLTSFLATDLYRWIGMSASLGLILTLSFIGKGATPKSGFTCVLLPFSILAPFGAGQIDRPFPLQQFILERLLF